MKTLVKLALVSMIAMAALVSTGCVKRDVVVIEADQTAFAVALTGDVDNQAQLYSEANLAENKVSAKRVFVDYERVKTRSGQMFSFMRPWYPKTKVIKVSLKPVTRAWTKSTESGTTAADQALIAETKESVAFSAEFNCNAQVDEANAAKFVHNYYGKQLESVIDAQVRPYAQQLFTEKCAEYTLDDLLLNKSVITAYVRDGVTQKFAEQGIRIMTLGMQGEIVYLNDEIQKSIDKRIQANNEMLANQKRNQQKVEAADAANKEATLLGGETALKIRQLEIERIKADTQRAAADKWDGKLPVTMIPGGTTPLLNLQ